MSFFEVQRKPERTYWNQPDLDDPAQPSNQGGPWKDAVTYDDWLAMGGSLRPERWLATTAAAKLDANLISSLTDRGTHMPVLDIDAIPMELRPSKTPGHFHLFIDKELTWEQYDYLLGALEYAGIVEPNYVTAARQARQTFVRKDPAKRPERVPGIGPRHYR